VPRIQRTRRCDRSDSPVHLRYSRLAQAVGFSPQAFVTHRQKDVQWNTRIIPVCTLTGSARELDDSFRSVAAKLGVSLREIPDWTCCGASSAHMVDAYLEVALPARDLLKAEGLGKDIVAPCAACHLRLKTASKRISRKMKSSIGSFLSRVTSTYSPVSSCFIKTNYDPLSCKDKSSSPWKGSR
jgi:Fe-S oxidoreductase